MIKIRPYKFTDKYQYEKMVKLFYQNNKIEPPDSQQILETIGYFTSFPQCGKIYMLLYKDNPIGYAVIRYIWKMQYAKISYQIEELYVNKDYMKYKPEINLVEYLIKDDEVHSIEIKFDKLKSVSRRIFRFLKFSKVGNPYFVKKISEN